MNFYALISLASKAKIKYPSQHQKHFDIQINKVHTHTYIHTDVYIVYIHIYICMYFEYFKVFNLRCQKDSNNRLLLLLLLNVKKEKKNKKKQPLLQ